MLVSFPAKLLKLQNLMSDALSWQNLKQLTALPGAATRCQGAIEKN